MDTNNFHTPVFLQETIRELRVESGKKYIDATIGGGGHTFAILERGGFVLGIDVDQEALNYVQEKIENEKLKMQNWDRLTLARGNFRDIGKIAIEKGFEKVDGIVFDLGVSSHQLDTEERGFSFREGKLDMRMDKSLSVTAGDLVNGLTVQELSKLFWNLGEERFAKKIAKAIVEKRKKTKIETTEQLADLIEEIVPKTGLIHPATRVFQALRIAVNDELNNLRTALPKAVNLLDTKGRLVVLSFHSLEDRIVKHAFSSFEKGGLGTIITKKPIVPSEREIRENRRSRSVKMRVFEKL